MPGNRSTTNTTCKLSTIQPQGMSRHIDNGRGRVHSPQCHLFNPPPLFRIAVGTRTTRHVPHRSHSAALTHALLRTTRKQQRSKPAWKSLTGCNACILCCLFALLLSCSPHACALAFGDRDLWRSPPLHTYYPTWQSAQDYVPRKLTSEPERQCSQLVLCANPPPACGMRAYPMLPSCIITGTALKPGVGMVMGIGPPRLPPSTLPDASAGEEYMMMLDDRP